MIKPVRWLVMALLVVAVTGCASTADSPHAPTGGASEGALLTTGAATQVVDGTQVTLTVAPWPPATLIETSLTVTVRQGDRAVTGRRPVLDLTMPGMTMPENRPVAAEGEPGVYLAQTILTMGGRWQIDVQLDLAEGAQTASFLLDAHE